MKVRKSNMLYRYTYDQWGKHELYYIDFDRLIKYWPRQEKIYINDDILCNYRNISFNESIQQYYQEWVEEEIERLLLDG